MFENRTYRHLHQKKGLISFNVTVKETNLNIQAETDLTDMALKHVLDYRNQIETYIQFHLEFATSLVPVKNLFPVPAIITDMLEAGRMAQVGPMAAVAGAVAQFCGTAMLSYTREVIVENGGDIFVKSDSETVFSIYAKNSPFSMTTGIRIEKRDKPYGLCTSSGTFGHSKSFGKTDATTILSDSCSLADAVATMVGNRVQTGRDIKDAIEAGKSVPGVQGIVIIIGENIGLWGDLKLVRLSP